MSRSSGAALTVLGSVRVLYDLGSDLSLRPGELLAALDEIGITGMQPDEEPYLAMLGLVLRLMLRHAEVEVDEMFAAAEDDLHELGREIDQEKFREIVSGFDAG